jgi:predicted RNA-binding protein YlxR (DUF448 family)
MKPKAELIRIVRSPEDDAGNSTISLDRRGKASGRGAYVCPDEKCLRLAQRSKALERQLEREIAPEVFEQLALEIARREDGA